MDSRENGYDVLPKVILPSHIKEDWDTLVLKPSFEHTIDNAILTPVMEEKGRPKEFSFILFGPPGTGKTSVPSALAKKLGWKLFNINPQHFFLKDGSPEYAVGKCFEEIKQFVLNEVQQKIKRNKKLKKKIRQTADCIFVFDEIDELVITREDGADRQSRLATTMMLPLFNDLREFAKSHGFIFFALTNHIRRFDPAIKRTGRFDLILPVGPPERSVRYLYFEKCIENLRRDYNELGITVNDFDYVAGKKVHTVDLNVISLASNRLGFGDIKTVCTRVFDQMKLNEHDALSDFLARKRRNPGIANHIMLPLTTSSFLSWINRQRNSNKDIQSEFDRFYEEYAIYSRGSSPNSELNQIQEMAENEFDAINVKDNLNNPETILQTKKNFELKLKIRNLAETNSFDGKIEIYADGAGYKRKLLKTEDIFINAGNFTEPIGKILVHPTKIGKLTIIYIIEGNFILKGVSSLLDNPTLHGVKVAGSVKKVI